MQSDSSLNILCHYPSKESSCNAGDPSWNPELGSFSGEVINSPLQYSWAYLVAQTVKKSTYSMGDLGSIPGLRTYPGGGHGKPLLYSCLENPHEQRKLAGYRPCGYKESDMTERLSTQHGMKLTFSSPVPSAGFSNVLAYLV